MNIHPRFAGFIILPYGLIGGLLGKRIGVNFFNNIIFYFIGIVLTCIVYKILLDRYDGVE